MRRLNPIVVSVFEKCSSKTLPTYEPSENFVPKFSFPNFRFQIFNHPDFNKKNSKNHNFSLPATKNQQENGLQSIRTTEGVYQSD